MKDCFLKLNKLSADDMVKISKITLDSVQKTEWEMSFGSSEIYWKKDMQFIFDLILPESLKQYVDGQYMSVIPPFTTMEHHTDLHRDALIYLPIHPIKEDYKSLIYYHNDEQIRIDNYDIGQVYLCNTKIVHSVNNNIKLPRYCYQISLNGKSYEDLLSKIT